MIGENGDTLVGKWKATVSGTEIDCRKSSINDNRYICAFNGYRAIVTWKSNVFTWHGGRRHYGRATGFITFESGVRAPRMIWSSGAVWRKQTKGTFEWLYDSGITIKRYQNMYLSVV